MSEQPVQTISVTVTTERFVVDFDVETLQEIYQESGYLNLLEYIEDEIDFAFDYGVGYNYSIEDFLDKIKEEDGVDLTDEEWQGENSWLDSLIAEADIDD